MWYELRFSCCASVLPSQVPAVCKGLCSRGASGRVGGAGGLSLPGSRGCNVSVTEGTSLVHHVSVERASQSSSKIYSDLCKSTLCSLRTGKGISKRSAIKNFSQCISLLYHLRTTWPQICCFCRVFWEFFGDCSQKICCEFPHISLPPFTVWIGPCCLGSLWCSSLSRNKRNKRNKRNTPLESSN